MAGVVLTVETGRNLGTRPSRRLRRSGWIPAVVYGQGGDSMAVSIDQGDLRTALATESGLNALVTLDVEGVEQLSIIKDLQRHPVRRDVLHIDFLRIDPDRELEVDVPLVLTGEAKKVTQASGMVDQIIHRLPIRARPADIPVEVVADVSDLEVGSSLRVGDISLPEGVAVTSDSESAFAVGLITRSTKEYLRQLKQAEEDAELYTPEGELPGSADDTGGRGDGVAGDDQS